MQSGSYTQRKMGFTLVELLVVLSILALLLSLAYPKYFSSVERAQDAALKQTLNTVREGIDKYYADTGKYPDSLEELVEKKYINKLPLDPITDSTTTWVLDQPEPPLEGMVYDIHSGATTKAKDGSPYSEW
ncbi:MAG: type II secretion system protein G [Methylophilales bacterium 28-44-11]|nr:MAG: type II secretion system protein G [Methylophilales bacterium 28-44-11]OYY97636.1 MAG: type II secretion system protein G [Methylophilales bacterium 16-45-7]